MVSMYVTLLRTRECQSPNLAPALQVYQVPDALNPEFPIDGTSFFHGTAFLHYVLISTDSIAKIRRPSLRSMHPLAKHGLAASPIRSLETLSMATILVSSRTPPHKFRTNRTARVCRR